MMASTRCFTLINTKPSGLDGCQHAVQSITKRKALLRSAQTIRPVYCVPTQVAVKVQRPRVLASVGLDLYVMRKVAAALQRLPSVRTPAVAPPACAGAFML